MKKVLQLTKTATALNYFGLILILLSSSLLGVWALKGTIALRNILLWMGAPLAIYYSFYFFKTRIQEVPLKNWSPLFFLGLMYCWIIFHFLFLSRFPNLQLNELTSTWLRTILGILVGFGAGLAISKRPSMIICLWTGILMSFIYLLYQYVPNALAAKTFFPPVQTGNLFYGKISGVLAGTILLIGSLGALVDIFRRSDFNLNLQIFIFWITSTTIVLYSYVYIFDTRSGIGLAVLIYLILLIIILCRFFRLIFTNKHSIKKVLNLLFLLGLLVSALLFFSIQHIKHNNGWRTMIEDTKTSVQIYNYSNWQNPRSLGYPKNADGETVKSNTYERIAWASAGVRIFLPENLLGVGILANPFSILLLEDYPNAGAYISSTHSAWVEIALAFGLPGLSFILLALASTATAAIKVEGNFQALIGLLSVGLMMLYAIGELSSQHSIEILFFLISFMNALSIGDKQENYLV